jgi:hypothetical protein
MAENRHPGERWLVDVADSSAATGHAANSGASASARSSA